MMDQVAPDIVEKWLSGWSLSRALPLPVPFQSGFRVDVGHQQQRARYVFPRLDIAFIRLSERINTPWIFLKVCATPDQVKHVVSHKWVLQPPGYMMHCLHRMLIPDLRLPPGYTLTTARQSSAVYIVRVVTQSGESASIGRVVLVDDMAVYDRILTGENHRRKGLATIVMKALEELALAKNAFKNFLVATDEGQFLYRSLGWELYSPYTSVVIPGT
ncbi:GNAT family N-acetyltransferase [Niabella beijingensis]|uniref:GNAT family N-acetyltransferase n=1 Tax=Niabella beijingensis TaxID=2872700 RepID=UPI001CC1AE83|nr:GNAT family N-acetyltransferase [Niabella beijingensis]MBZ4191835.1 GNAT family N-acetyltransferase [Niabella beijingensis]